MVVEPFFTDGVTYTSAIIRSVANNVIIPSNTILTHQEKIYSTYKNIQYVFFTHWKVWLYNEQDMKVS